MIQNLENNKISVNNNILTFDEKRVLSELKLTLNNFLGTQLVGYILFGSKARGDFDSHSDIDIAIIVRGLTRSLKDRILEKVAEIELKHLLPISTVVFSEDDFNRLRQRQRQIAIDIEKEGIVL